VAVQVRLSDIPVEAWFIIAPIVASIVGLVLVVVLDRMDFWYDDYNKPPKGGK
jgi:hypothetical protein